jgi:hypothetical protein
MESECPFHKNPPVVILSQINSIYELTLNFINTHCDIIFLSIPVSSRLSFSFTFPHITPHALHILLILQWRYTQTQA